MSLRVFLSGFTQVSLGIDKRLWMVQANLQEGWRPPLPEPHLPRSSSVKPRVGTTSQVSGAAMRSIQAVILLVFLAAIGVFTFQNRDVITVRFSTWNLSEPVAFVTVVVYFLGMLSGWTVVAFVRGSFRRITEHPRH